MQDDNLQQQIEGQNSTENETPGAEQSISNDQNSEETDEKAVNKVTKPFDETRVTRIVKRVVKTKLKQDRKRNKAYLLVKRSNVPEARIDFDSDIIVIGRDADVCDIILDDDDVSRRHAQITLNDKGYYTLIDCNYKNGTLVDELLISSMNLCDKDKFVIGDNVIEFRLEK